jgi:hypothetical protein
LPGQRIYYVPPRLVGSIADWSGKDSPDGRSWLLDRAERLKFNAVWFSPFFETSHRKTINAEGQPVSNSLYATRHHGVLDPEFSATKAFISREGLSAKELAEIDRKDREHLDHFTAQAKRQGLTVMAMADLVFNHLASDHPAVLQEEQEVEAILQRAKAQGATVKPITKTVKDKNGKDEERVIGLSYTDHAQVGGSPEKQLYFKFCRNHQFETLNIGMTTGYDTAQINYESPAAKQFFVTGENGQPGYWKQVMDWCMDRGLSDFRCDIAYRVPPDWWTELITHARQRDPHTVFMAETLGGSDEEIRRMAEIRVKDADGKERPGFDLGMISNYWWNFTDDWLPDGEVPRLGKMAKFGGAASPDSHDTKETLAGAFQKALKGQANRDKLVADISARNYAISAFIGNSVYMQMGYELCKETQNGVFKGDGSPAELQELMKQRDASHPLNIESRIAAINGLKESLGLDNCIVTISEHKEMQDGKFIKLACEYADADTGKKVADVVLVLNKSPEKNGTVQVTDPKLLDLETSGLSHMHDKGGKLVVRDFLIYHTPAEDIFKAQLPPPAPKAARRARAGFSAQP